MPVVLHTHTCVCVYVHVPNRKDAYSGAEYIQEGFQIEQASVLYNIAALHAQLGSHGKRDTEQVSIGGFRGD